MRAGLDFAVGKATEEAGEVLIEVGGLLHAIGKTLRWGWQSVNPELAPEDQETNAAWVRRKIADAGVEIVDLQEALNNLGREMTKGGL
jgi:hypothetical protein